MQQTDDNVIVTPSGDVIELPEMTDNADGFLAADPEHIRRERAKTQELRQSQWWKNLRGQGKCHYCGKTVPPKELTMDHIIPIARGGMSTKSNIVPCCKDCNSRKKYMLPLEWEEYLKGLPEPTNL